MLKILFSPLIFFNFWTFATFDRVSFLWLFSPLSLLNFWAFQTFEYTQFMWIFNPWSLLNFWVFEAFECAKLWGLLSPMSFLNFWAVETFECAQFMRRLGPLSLLNFCAFETFECAKLLRLKIPLSFFNFWNLLKLLSVLNFWDFSVRWVCLISEFVHFLNWFSQFLSLSNLRLCQISEAFQPVEFVSFVFVKYYSEAFETTENLWGAYEGFKLFHLRTLNGLRSV